MPLRDHWYTSYDSGFDATSPQFVFHEYRLHIDRNEATFINLTLRRLSDSPGQRRHYEVEASIRRGESTYRDSVYKRQGTGWQKLVTEAKAELQARFATTEKSTMAGKASAKTIEHAGAVLNILRERKKDLVPMSWIREQTGLSDREVDLALKKLKRAGHATYEKHPDSQNGWRVTREGLSV